MSYSRHFCATMLDHYQHLLKSAESEEQEAVILRNIRLYKSQLKQHDRKDNTMCNHSDRTDIAVHYYPAPEGLTYQERKAHAALAKVRTDAIGFEGARTALAAGTVSKFRQLIRELLDQIRDAPVTTRRILGKEAFEAVYNLGFADVST